MGTHLQPRTPLFIVPAQWTNDERGNYFERFVADLLTCVGWKCKTRLRFTGMEIDVLAISKVTKDVALVQCKFQRDPLSSNVVDLLLGQALRRAEVTNTLLFSIAPLGKEARGVVDDLEASPPAKKFGFFGPSEILELINGSSSSQVEQTYLQEHGRNVASSHLLIHPDYPRLWLHEEQINGLPVRVVVDGDSTINCEELATAIHAAGVFEDLPFEPTRSQGTLGAPSPPIESHDTVAPVPVADSIDDYRPCRPSDFIGRKDLLKELRSFLESIQNGTNISRVLALTGHSGFGKSSLVLKLAEQFRSQKRHNKIFIFAIDTRSARHKSFVSAAVYECLRAAVSSGFLPEPPDDMSVPSEGPILSSNSVRWALSKLTETRRALVIFFDQFEEVLSKDELRPAFDAMHALALEVHSEKGPLVLGFSWRLGITLSEDNPAYYLWHGISDIRRTFEVGRFSETETNGLIAQFEKANRIPLLIPLRKRIRDQSLSLPWLTKKLSIHVYNQIGAGAEQIALLAQRLNVVTLFQEDLADLSPAQISCLKSIAIQSPVDLTKIADDFSNEIVNSLVTRRLVVRTGGRLAPYWDIFRDFLRDDRVPAIPWQWLPLVSPSMAIPVLMHLQASGGISLQQLATRTEYSEGTVQNIVSDLQNVALVRRNESRNIYEMLSSEGRTVIEIAEFVGQQLRDNAIVRALYSSLPPGSALSADEFKVLFHSLAHGRSAKTLDSYRNVFVGWMLFGGILELHNAVLHRPLGRSAQLGVLRAGRRERGIGFVAASEPNTVVDSAIMLQRGRALRSRFPRNACTDLTGLQIAYYDGKYIVPNSILRPAMSAARVRAAVLKQAELSSFLLAHRAVAKATASAVDEGLALAELLGKEWSSSSAIRYASAARRWQRAIVHEVDTSSTTGRRSAGKRSNVGR
jgi:hypothetical protein